MRTNKQRNEWWLEGLLTNVKNNEKRALIKYCIINDIPIDFESAQKESTHRTYKRAKEIYGQWSKEWLADLTKAKNAIKKNESQPEKYCFIFEANQRRIPSSFTARTVKEMFGQNVSRQRIQVLSKRLEKYKLNNSHSANNQMQ